MKYKDAIRKRRSVYSINDQIKLSETELIDIIEHNVKHTPSAFNSQSQRIVLLLGKENHKFWDLTKSIIKPIVAAENFSNTAKKIDGFKAGYGTVLYFDDTEVTNGLISKFTMYEKNFMRWSEQQNGMLQSNIWSALAEVGIGASLQHYNDLIAEQVQSTFNIPKTWRLIAEMPFGGIVQAPLEKEFIDVKKRIVIKK